MIKSLDIQNFQSHQDTTLEFDKGVNIIVGNSDSGKTAIIRALRWLVFNKPTGDEMRSHWGGKTRVELFTDDAHVVKSKDKEQEYVLGDIHFKAFGTEVPVEITQVLNLNSINLQNQLDAPFLLSETPGAVASHFNKVANLDKIDLATQNVNSWIRELTSTIGIEAIKDKPATGLIKQIKEAEEELKKFEHLEKFEVDVEVLEELEKRLTIQQNLYSKLEAVLKSNLLNERQIKELQFLLELEKPINTIFKWKDEKEKLEKDFDKLYSFIGDWYKLNDKIEYLKETISIEIPIKDLLKLYEKRKTFVNEQKQLFKIISSIKDIQVCLKKANENYSTIKTEFENAMPEGSICPLCNQIIKK